jgi:hypothetical protein
MVRRESYIPKTGRPTFAALIGMNLLKMLFVFGHDSHPIIKFNPSGPV